MKHIDKLRKDVLAQRLYVSMILANNCEPDNTELEGLQQAESRLRYAIKMAQVKEQKRRSILDNVCRKVGV
jgi:hypothetical protein